MRKIGFKVMFVCAVAFAIGCGSDSSNDAADAADNADARTPMPLDAGPDADLRDATPPPTDDGGMLLFGPGVILETVHLAPTGHSWSSWAPLVNPQFDSAIEDGEMIVLLELRNLDDPSGQNDDDVQIAILVGQDADFNPADNFSGSETINVSPSSLDSIGNPLALLPNASITNGQLSGSVTGEITLFLPGIGAVQVQDPTFSATLIAANDNESIARIEAGQINSILLAQDLEAVDNPVPGTCLASSMLDLVSLPCLSFDGAQPDIDRDGDGLETFEEVKDSFNGQIDLCTDGNGTTYASSATVQCVLDPAFADGYTVTIDVEGPRVFIAAPL